MGMKSVSTIRIRVAAIARFLVFSIALLALTTCDLFKAGLGSKIDVSTPTVDVTSLENGDYINSARTLSGTVSDDVQVKGVAVAVYSGSTLVSTLNASLSGSSWSVVLDPAALFPNQEAQADLVIQVTDNSGKASERRLAVYFDTIDPVVSNLNPSMENLAKADTFLSEIVSFQGSVKDGFGVESLSFLAGGSELWDATRGTSPWTVYADTTAFAAGTGGVTDSGGGVLSVPVSIVATDKAGNASTPLTGLFLVDQNRSAPWITGPNTLFFQKIVLDPDTATTILAPQERLVLKISDAEGIDASSIIAAIRTASAAPASVPPFEYTIANGGIAMTPLQEDEERLLKAELAITLPAAGALPEGLGEYAFSIAASDDVDLKASLPSKAATVATRSYAGISLTISNAVPTLTVASPANGAIVRDLAAEGTIIDGIGVDSVMISVDGAAAVEATLAAPEAKTSPWSYAPAAPLAEGSHQIDLYGINIGEKTSSITQRQFVVDRTSPTLEILSVAPSTTNSSLRPTVFADVTSAGDPGGVYNLVNGVARVRVSATDQNPLRSVTWSLTSVDGSATYVPATAVASWAFDVDTTAAGLALADGTKYRIVLEAIDEAGNETVLERTLLVSQAGDEPTFTLKNMTSLATTEASAVSNLMLSNPRIEAVVMDDDWVDAGTIRMLLDQDPLTAPASSWVPLSGTLTADGSVSFGCSFSDGIVIPALADGRHYVTLRAADTDVHGTDGRKAGKAAVSGSIGPVYFAIDLAPPALSFAGAGAGLFVSSTTPLSGTAFSANAISDFHVRPQGAADWGTNLVGGADWTAAAPLGTFAWSYDLDVASFDADAATAGLQDGEMTVSIRAIDEFGVSNVQNLKLTVDRAPPVVEIAAPSPMLSGSRINGIVLVRGTSSDINPIDAVEYAIDAGTYGTAGLAGTAASWSFQLNTTASGLNLADGAHTIRVRARDRAGNIGTQSYVVTVNQDSDLPTFTFGNSDDGLSTIAQLRDGDGFVVQNSFGPNNNELLATALDDDWITAGSISIAIERNAGGDAGTWTTVAGYPMAVTHADASGTSVAIRHSLAGLTDGFYRFTLSAQDDPAHKYALAAVAGQAGPVCFGYDTGAPQLAVLSQIAATNGAAPTSGTVTDGSAVLRAQYSVDGINFLNCPTFAAGAWSCSPSLPAPDGNKTVTIRAIDEFNNIGTISLTVLRDTEAPTTTPTNPIADSIFYGSTASLSGTSSDGAGHSGVMLVQYAMRLRDSGTALSWNALSGSSSWSGTVDTTSIPEGRYEIFFRATDNANNVAAASAPLYVIVDEEAPTVTVTSPAADAIMRVASLFSGQAVDPADASIAGRTNGVSSVVVAIDDPLLSSSTPAACGGADFAHSSTWNYSIDAGDFAALAQGRHVLYVRATDKAGLQAVSSIAFYKDTLAPVAAFGNLAAAGTTVLKDPSPSISGTLSDATGVASMDIRLERYDYSAGGWEATPVFDWTTLGPTGGAATVPWSYDLGAALADGRYRVTVRSSDAASPVNSDPGTSREFRIDRNVPALAISVPAMGTYQRQDFAVSGTVSDLNTVSSVYVKIDSTVFPAGATPAALSGTPPTGTLSWSVASMDVDALSQGTHTLYVYAQDATGSDTMLARDFTLDSAQPAITVGSPASGTRSVGNLTIIGTSSDPGTSPSGVTGGIQYQIGRNADLGNPPSWSSANVTGGAYSWTIALGAMSAYANATYAEECNADGSPRGAGPATNLWRLPIYFQAADNAGNIRQKTDYYLILDPDGNIPVVTLTQPTQNGLTYGGQQRITGTATQPIWIHDVEVAVDPAGGSNFPASPVPVEISGSAISAAGNPFTNGMTLFLSGSPQPQIGGVAVSATTPYFVVNRDASGFQLSSSSGGSPVAFSAAGDDVTASVWARATILSSGNNVMWYYDINQGNYLPQGGALSQTVTVMARAWNSATPAGDRGNLSGTLSSALSMKFDSTFPKVQDIRISPNDDPEDPDARDYFSQISVSGAFYVHANVVSSKGIARIERVEVNVGSGSTRLYSTSDGYGPTFTVTPPTELPAGSFPYTDAYQLIITELGTTDWNAIGFVGTPEVGAVFNPSGPGDGATSGRALASDPDGDFVYEVAIPIDSTDLYDGTTGVYAFDIRATDMTTPAQVSSQTVTLNEDNYYPTATISSTASVIGTQYVIQGTATDVGLGSGPITGFDRVVAYVMRGGQVVNMLDGTSSAAGSITARDMSAGGTVRLVSFPGSEDGDAAIVDDLLENNSLPTAGGVDRNGDQFIEYLGLTGTTYNWAIQIDSTEISDGPAVVHVVAFDSVGNATHYEQAVFFRNNAPTITGITLGTDLNGDGAIGDIAGETSGFTSAQYAATGFIARNSKLSFTIAASGANTPLYYSVRYPNAAGTELITMRAPGSFTAGRLYRVAYLGASPNFTASGAASNTVDAVFVASNAGSGTGYAYELSSGGGGTAIAGGSVYYISSAGSNAVDFGAASNAVGTFFTANEGGTLTGGAAIRVDTFPSSAGTVAIYSFPGAAAISDSAAANDRSFSVRVYDSTPGTTPGVDSQVDTETISLTIRNLDSTDPVVTMRQLYWTSASDNSVLDGDASNGHVDLGALAGAADELDDTDPRASGRIRHEGTVFDDQRIQYLRMRIYAAAGGGFDFAGGSAYGAWHTVASWNTATKALEGADEFTSHGWRFILSGATIGSSGHSANWRLEWDTARINGGADTNLTVEIQAQDFANPGTDAVGTANHDETSRQLDVVPYILRLSTPDPFTSRLSNNSLNSGRGGYYAYYQGTPGVVVTGFNLLASETQTAGVDEITIGSTRLPIAAGGADSSRGSLTVSIPATLTTSGAVANSYLTVTTNGLASINNVNDIAAAYNSSNAANGDSTADNRNRRQVYIDELAPEIEVAAFGSRFPNSVYDDSDHGSKAAVPVSAYTENIDYSGTDPTIRDNWLGHVEYAGDTTLNPATADISGQVVFQGRAMDNQRIARITAAIPGFSAYTITLANGTDTFTSSSNHNLLLNQAVTFSWTTQPGGAVNGTGPYYVCAIPTATTFRVSATRGGAAVDFSSNGADITIPEFNIYTLGNAFTAAGFLSGAHWSARVDGEDNDLDAGRVAMGHVLNWDFIWDSAYVANGAATAVGITFRAYDGNYAPNYEAASSEDAITVDIVPYIASVTRNEDLYNTNRSKYGKYPVTQGETGIVVEGFNLLASAVQNPTNWVRIYNARSGGTNDADAITVSAPAATRRQFTMSLNGAQNSGWLRVQVNGVDSINNVNTSTKSWQKEDDGSGLALTMWNDDRYLSVWNVDRWANSNAFAGSSNAQYPTFAVNNAGTLYAAWVNYATAYVTYNSINGTNGTAGGTQNILNLYDPSEFADISIDSSNNMAITYIQNTYGGSGAWTSDNSGSVNVWASGIGTGARLYQADDYPNWGSRWYAFRTDGLWHNSMLWEHYSPKVVRNGSDIHVAWYDDLSKSIKYAYFSAGLNSSAEQGWINIDGGTNGASDATAPGIGYVTNFATGLERADSVGSSVSIDVDDDGYPVIAYYDNENHALRIAHARDSSPTALGEWRVQAVGGGSLDSYAGANSSDRNGNISLKINHSNGLAYLVAYRPSRGQMVYSSAAARNADAATNTDYDFNDLSLLDADGNVGSWSDMSLTGAATRPVMAYQNKSMLGTYDGAKVAYWDTDLPTPDWETVIVPAKTYVSDGKLSVAYNTGYTDVPWTMAVGFKSAAFNVAYLQPRN